MINVVGNFSHWWWCSKTWWQRVMTAARGDTTKQGAKAPAVILQCQEAHEWQHRRYIEENGEPNFNIILRKRCRWCPTKSRFKIRPCVNECIPRATNSYPQQRKHHGNYDLIVVILLSIIFLPRRQSSVSCFGQSNHHNNWLIALYSKRIWSGRLSCDH